MIKNIVKTIDIDGKKLSLETGVLAPQATAAILARMGDTMVLSTVVVGKENPSLDYFPLSVEYIERLYAGGRIKGSRWVKREGRPSDDAILTARLIDRSIRPLFPKGFKKEVQVVVTVLSVDGENDSDILSMVATSAALSISKIPWDGPIGATRIGIVREKGNGKKEFIINPDSSESDILDLDMVVSGTGEKTIMIEAGAKEVLEEDVFEAIKKAAVHNKKIIEGISELVKETGEEKEKVKEDEAFQAALALVEKSYKAEIVALIENGVKKEVGSEISKLVDRISELGKISEQGLDRPNIAKVVDYVFKKTVKEIILSSGKRPDGRKEDEIRQISSKISVLPRTHGSAIFQRGETQVLTVVTLGMPSLEQSIEGPEGEEVKRYMHHYSMPPYSVGEAGRIGTPSRREIGHGALAERALLAVVPAKETFPYAIRVVSEVMSSNGSTSMASTCGSTLALIDAGVPIKEPVAGIAIGLVSDDKKYVILSDIMGLEDFSGDMDFKVAGSKNGITAIQLDVKIKGLTFEMIEKILTRAREGRLFILEKMLEVIPDVRKGLSVYAPKVKVVKIDTGKIGEVIGSGGKVIRNIIATTGANVEVADDGSVTISSQDEKAVEKAVAWIDLLTRELTPGEVFEGKVKRLLSFGAMVEIVPGKEGLVHVSEISDDFVEDITSVLSVGQAVKVRVKEIDDQGRINLSMLFGERPERKNIQKDTRPRHDFPRRDRFERRRRY